MPQWTHASEIKDEGVQVALLELLTQAADDDLVLGHRDSEWLGLAPAIEEDIAFSSISQDEVGHAAFLYGLVHDLGGSEPDDMAFARPAPMWRNAGVLERQNGDWAYTLVRHYFYDQFETVRLEALVESAYGPLADGARKIVREEYYHRVHFDLHFRKLLTAGGEAALRMTTSIEAIRRDLWTLFDFGEAARVWVEHGLMSQRPERLQETFLKRVNEPLSAAQIPVVTVAELSRSGGGRTTHTDDLFDLIHTMAEVRGTEATASW